MNISGILNPLRRYDISSRDMAKTARGKASFEEQIARQSTGDTASASTSTAAADLPDASVTISGEEYLKLYQESATANSAEVKSAAEHKALITAADNAAFENTPVTESEEILDRLSDSARATLEDIKADKEVSREEWSGLLEELRDMGAISDTELGYTRGFRIIPLGYTDKNGVFVKYDDPFSEARLLQLAGLETSEDAVVDWNWNNDPLAFLDDWIAELTEWRDDLSRERSASGAPKYDDFSPIDDQVAACTKVSELVKDLAAQTE